MNRSLLAVAALALGAGLATGASATVLTFDDIGIEGLVPTNYGGLDWSAAGWAAFGGEQAPYTAHSGDWRVASVWEGTDATSVIRFTAPTVFTGAWFSGLGGATVTFELYSRGQRVATSATLDPSSTPAFLASGYAGAVDAVRVSSPHHASFAMDDFTFTAAVPEPHTYALMLLGIAAIGAAARRRQS
jgi:hypothetical protein